jgi:hypothetical protein
MALLVEKTVLFFVVNVGAMWIPNILGKIDQMFPWVLWLGFSALSGEKKNVFFWYRRTTRIENCPGLIDRIKFAKFGNMALRLIMLCTGGDPQLAVLPSDCDEGHALFVATLASWPVW